MNNLKQELEAIQGIIKENGFGSDGNKQAAAYLKIRDLITRLDEQPLNTFNKTASNVEWEQEAERYATEMHGTDEAFGPDRYQSTKDFLAGCQFASSLDRQRAEQIWEAAERYGRDQEYVLKPEGQIYPDKETFLNEMFGK